jgi:hypothetical protein
MRWASDGSPVVAVIVQAERAVRRVRAARSRMVSADGCFPERWPVIPSHRGGAALTPWVLHNRRLEAVRARTLLRKSVGLCAWSDHGTFWLRCRWRGVARQLKREAVSQQRSRLPASIWPP